MVKWGTLLHLAAQNDLRAIFYVAYAPAEEDAAATIFEDASSEPIEIPKQVSSHFRPFRRFEGLKSLHPLKIRMMEESFNFRRREREEYNARALDLLKRTPRPCAVLLDPDTGIAAKPSRRHVTPAEIEGFWKDLGSADWLVIYQHASRVAGVRNSWASSRRLFVMRAFIHSARSRPGLKTLASSRRGRVWVDRLWRLLSAC